MTIESVEEKSGTTIHFTNNLTICHHIEIFLIWREHWFDHAVFNVGIDHMEQLR